MIKPKLAVSACLLGQKVRYDGGDKHDNFIIEILSTFAELVPFCPEVEMGMGIPREPVRLVSSDGHISLMGTKSNHDYTSLSQKISWDMAGSLSGVDGIIFMKKSPSCGPEKVKVFHKNIPQSNGIGVFAKTFTQRFPEIPHIDSGRLLNNSLKEHFLGRVFSYFIYKQVKDIKDLQNFHKAHKYVIMEHSPQDVARLGRLASGNKKLPISHLKAEYLCEFSKVLNTLTTRKKKYNVFLHLMGYLKDYLIPKEKRDLIKLFDHYKSKKTNYVSVWTLLKHYIEKYDIKYLKDHVYFNPISDQLGLLQFKD